MHNKRSGDNHNDNHNHNHKNKSNNVINKINNNNKNNNKRKGGTCCMTMAAATDRFRDSVKPCSER